MNGVSDSHIAAIGAPDHSFHMLLEFLKGVDPLSWNVEKLGQRPILPVARVAEELKELDFFDLEWKVIAEWWKKYIQILMDYQYGEELYCFEVGVSIARGNI